MLLISFTHVSAHPHTHTRARTHADNTLMRAASVGRVLRAVREIEDAMTLVLQRPEKTRDRLCWLVRVVARGRQSNLSLCRQ